MRVNVISTKVRKAFILRSGKVEVDEAGPVIDLFGGQIALGEDDYIVTTEAARHWFGTAVRGEASLEYQATRDAGGYLFTKAALPNGPEADFVIDLGSSKTVVTKAFLPAGVRIRQAAGVEYSDKGCTL